MNKNILIVTSEFPPMPGGIGNHSYCLAKELNDLGYAVTVLTEQREQKHGDWQQLIKSNTDINIIGIRRQRVIVFTYLLRLLYLYKLISRNSYKTVIYSGKFSVWLNAIVPRTKSVVVVHGSEIKQKGLLNLLFSKGLEKAGYVVCVSNYTKNQLVLQYKNLDIGKVVIINNGFKDDWIDGKSTEREIRNSKIVLITVGGIHKRKGQFNVVRALPSIIKYFPETEYHIVGLPIEKDELLKLIDAEKVNKYVTFHHGLSDDQVKDILRNSDVFIMLSEHLENGDFEGFGIAVMEAMALGLPAVGTRNSGIADAIKDGYSGRLVNLKNFHEVANSIKEIMDDYRTYSANAKEWADGFKWKNKRAEYQALIEKS